ncbi:MAG: HDIG domain-containing metalloprotein [Oscillospiraceae bacterium]
MSLHKLYQNINDHILLDNQPSGYLNTVYCNPLFRQKPFDLLYRLKETEQSAKHHPEGNVWNHTLLVLDEAAAVRTKSKNQQAFMWAALLHDIGKPLATEIRNGRVTAYDHDKIGAGLAKEFLKIFTDDSNFIQDVTQLIRYHMQILFVVNDLPFADVRGMIANTDIEEVALLGLCDRLGRAGCNRRREEKNIELFLKKCRVTNSKKPT